MPRANERRRWQFTALIVLAMTGCSEDGRVSAIALQTSAQQSQQNQELAKLNREVAEGTRRLVESRGNADQQILDQQREIQRGRDQLEAERDAFASNRNHESLLASTMLMLGELLVCSLPLILCWCLLHRLGPGATDAELTQFLVEQLEHMPPSGRRDGTGLSTRDGSASLSVTDSPSL